MWPTPPPKPWATWPDPWTMSQLTLSPDHEPPDPTQRTIRDFPILVHPKKINLLETAAKWSGVLSTVSRDSISVSLRSKSWVHWIWPLSTARCSGVFRPSVCISVSHPASRRISRHLQSPGKTKLGKIILNEAMASKAFKGYQVNIHRTINASEIGKELWPQIINIRTPPWIHQLWIRCQSCLKIT